MAGLRNPYTFEPARGDHFIGRQEILTRWRERLTANSESWKDSKGWMVVAPGGLGKTSLLLRMKDLAEKEFKANTIFLDLGHFRDINSPADLFEALDTYLPHAQRIGTRMKQWFNLPSDASSEDLVGQVGGALLDQLIGFSIGKVGGSGIKLPSLRASPRQPEGITARLAQIFNSLAILSEEQEAPTVVFLDQLGKCHDHSTWLFIASLFLDFVERSRYAEDQNIVFVIGMRPERKGELEHKIRKRRYFDEFLYEYIDLDPFLIDDAVRAINVRGKPYINDGLARMIVDCLKEHNTVDPYNVQLGAMAIWAHLHLGGETRCVIKLEDDPNEVRRIVLDGHAALIDPFQSGSDPVAWEILKLLSYYPGGLTQKEICNFIPETYNLSLEEINLAIQSLMNKQGYRLLRKREIDKRYAIAHDLLRDYINGIIPRSDSLLESARKLLSDGVWRYHLNFGYFAEEELNLIWMHRVSLDISSRAFEAITASCLFISNADIILNWFRYNNSLPLQAIQLCNPEDKIIIRRNIAQVILYNDFTGVIHILDDLTRYKDDVNLLLIIQIAKSFGEATLPVLFKMVQQFENESIRLEAAKALGELGCSEIALPVLSGLAQKSENENVRLEAAKALGKVGGLEASLAVLSELAQKSENENVRLEAAEALGKVGCLEASLAGLSDLAQKGKDKNVRLVAMEALGKLGEAALPVLVELAQKNEDTMVHLMAVDDLDNPEKPILPRPVLLRPVQSSFAGERVNVWLPCEEVQFLIEQGEASLPVLSELAWKSEDEYLRLEATEALGKLGKASLPALSELALKSEYEYLRLAATRALCELGETALPALSDLALKSEDEHVRIYAIEALGDVGEAALPDLSELALNSEDEYSRWAATRALCELGETALPTLSDLALKSVDKNVRLIVMGTLGEMGEVALPVLAELTQKGKDEQDRLIATEMLVLLGEAALPVLSELAQKSENENVRFMAAGTLSKIGKIALPVLSELAQKCEDKNVRLKVVGTLGELGKIALPVLSELPQKSEYEDVRLMAVKYLCDMGEVALPALSDLAQKSGDSRIRAISAQTLCDMGEVALPVLSDLALKSGDEHVRIFAINALGEVGEAALPTLSYLALKGKDKMVRLAATRALCEFGETALPTLSDLSLKCKDKMVRLAATRALCDMGEVALPALSDLALKSEDEHVRIFAIKALGDVGEAALPDLSVLVEMSEDKLVYMQTIESLGLLGESAIPLLIKLAWKNPEEIPSSRAILHLLKILISKKDMLIKDVD